MPRGGGAGILTAFAGGPRRSLFVEELELELSGKMTSLQLLVVLCVAALASGVPTGELAMLHS